MESDAIFDTTGMSLGPPCGSHRGDPPLLLGRAPRLILLLAQLSASNRMFSSFLAPGRGNPPLMREESLSVTLMREKPRTLTMASEAPRRSLDPVYVRFPHAADEGRDK